MVSPHHASLRQRIVEEIRRLPGAGGTPPGRLALERKTDIRRQSGVVARDVALRYKTVDSSAWPALNVSAPCCGEVAMTDDCMNVLFLCTGSTPRSILAGPILRKDGAGAATYSAGSRRLGEYCASATRRDFKLCENPLLRLRRSFSTN